MRVFLRLVAKLLHELRLAVILAWAMLGIFFTLGSYLYVTFGDTTIDSLSRLSPELVTGIFGGLFAGVDPLEAWLLTLFLHPLIITLLAAATIAIAARSLAGEIERGTLDLLLAWPVPRPTLVLAAAAAIQLVQIAMVTTLWWAMRLGLVIGGIEPPDSLGRFVWVAVNLWALFAAVSGVSLWLSATGSEQAKAVGRAITFVVLSFFVNLLASLWRKVEAIDIASVFHYYQPQPVVVEGRDPILHLGVLLAIAACGHALALAAFVRRDVAAA
ncbi:MAG TPA: ABC transporter permease subunit [Thermoanaerobaculia bacterium]|nr:ABC transporter permease subunit [Thermoanaerobaculia bacterium]